MPPTLGYWNLRGLCEPIRYVLYHTEVDFEDKRYGFKTEPPYDFGQWGEDKHNLGLTFPNVPYYIDGDLKITQSLAILRYLGRKHGLSANNEDEQVFLDVAEQQVRDLQQALILVAYNFTDFDVKKEAYIQALPSKLELMDTFLKDKNFVLGDRLTYVDFMLYEVLDQHLFLVPDCLEKFESLLGFVARIENLPNIKKYINSDKFKRWPIFAPFAGFGGRGAPPK